MTAPVYVVMVLDRHTDPEPELYATRDSAIARARSIARGSSGWSVAHDEGLTASMAAAGWLYHAEWGHEGDYVFVVQREVRT